MFTSHELGHPENSRFDCKNVRWWTMQSVLGGKDASQSLLDPATVVWSNVRPNRLNSSPLPIRDTSRERCPFFVYKMFFHSSGRLISNSQSVASLLQCRSWQTNSVVFEDSSPLERSSPLSDFVDRLRNGGQFGPQRHSNPGPYNFARIVVYWTTGWDLINHTSCVMPFMGFDRLGIGLRQLVSN